MSEDVYVRDYVNDFTLSTVINVLERVIFKFLFEMEPPLH